MKNNSIQQTAVVTKTAKIPQAAIPGLSDNAFYLMALANQLKKMLGPVSLQHFLATGESVVFTKKHLN
jgi:hypothetical protein